MDVQKFYYICAIAKYQSMAKAARTHHITQPALSKAIVSVESELGVRLFTRGPTGTELTEYGKAFLPYAEDIIERYEAGLRAINEINGTHNNTVELLFPIPELVMQILEYFGQSQPDIEINQKYSSLESINKSLVNGELDLYVGQMIEPEGLVIKTPLYSEELLFIVPPEVQCEDYQTVAVADFDNWQFILPRKGEEMRGTIDSYFEKFGFFPQKYFEVQDDRAMRVLVEQSKGVSFISSVSKMNMELSYRRSGEIPVNAMHTLRIDNCIRDVNAYYTKHAIKQKGVLIFYNFLLDFIKNEIHKINEAFPTWNVDCLI